MSEQDRPEPAPISWDALAAELEATRVEAEPCVESQAAGALIFCGPYWGLEHEAVAALKHGSFGTSVARLM